MKLIPEREGGVNGCCVCRSVVSDSLRLCGLKSDRLFCPWDSPGKNTGLPCPPPGDRPSSGMEPISPASPALAGGFFTISTNWEALSQQDLVINVEHREGWLWLNGHS